nr:FAD-dependent oxidoreductase [Novosphingobium fluoreni]
MPQASSTVPTVAIIGGGFTGAAVAYHLARLADGPLRIVVFEPRAEIGQGVAYSTQDPIHRINVPAARMTLLPDDQEHFARWLVAQGELDGDPDATLANGQSFPARRLFGRYVAEHLQPLLASGQVEHHQGRIKSVASEDSGWMLVTDSGESFAADVIVIATSHPPPSPPSVLARAFGGEPKFIADPWAAGALAPIGREDSVLVVGTGLTMADTIATLDAQGHRGQITAISRRGQRSHSHADTHVEPFGDFATRPPRTALDLLRRVRVAARAGRPWQGLFDRLRVQGPDIWKALPLVERRRLIRHLRPFWDTHRFRIAPQIGAVLDRRIAEGTLMVEAASIQQAEMQSGRFAVTLQGRAGQNRSSALRRQSFNAVIATTGPGHGSILTSLPVLSGLLASGSLVPDPTGLGIAVDESSHLIGTQGPNPRAFVAGPLARGTFGELMGLPEVTNHAVFVAKNITVFLADCGAVAKRACPEPL